MPAKKATIFPQISQEANALLVYVCEAQGCTPGDVVEAALHALLNPQDQTDKDRVLLRGLLQLHEDFKALLAFHKKMLALLEAMQREKEVEVAGWDALYAEEGDEEGKNALMPMPTPVEALPPQPGGWRRLFPKKEK